jgi:hypothetical protein
MPLAAQLLLTQQPLLHLVPPGVATAGITSEKTHCPCSHAIVQLL